ncbi:MAG: hypothetical protein M3441_17120, partial [Chloroflexota bacterium]|nr:hypothetical protein [Chloroflexota bacterium]
GRDQHLVRLPTRAGTPTCPYDLVRKSNLFARRSTQSDTGGSWSRTFGITTGGRAPSIVSQPNTVDNSARPGAAVLPFVQVSSP